MFRLQMESYLMYFLRNLKTEESRALLTSIFYKLLESKKTNTSLDEDIVRAEVSKPINSQIGLFSVFN